MDCVFTIPEALVKPRALPNPSDVNWEAGTEKGSRAGRSKLHECAGGEGATVGDRLSDSSTKSGIKNLAQHEQSRRPHGRGHAKEHDQAHHAPGGLSKRVDKRTSQAMVETGSLKRNHRSSDGSPETQSKSSNPSSAKRTRTSINDQSRGASLSGVSSTATPWFLHVIHEDKIARIASLAADLETSNHTSC